MTGGKNTRPLWHAYLAVAGAWTFGGIVGATLNLVTPVAYVAEDVQRLAAAALIGTVFLFVLVERISNLIEFQREEREARCGRAAREQRLAAGSAGSCDGRSHKVAVMLTETLWREGIASAALDGTTHVIYPPSTIHEPPGGWNLRWWHPEDCTVLTAGCTCEEALMRRLPPKIEQEHVRE